MDGDRPPETRGTAAVGMTDTLLSHPVPIPRFLVPDNNRSFSWNPENKSKLIALAPCEALYAKGFTNMNSFNPHNTSIR